MLQTKFSVLNRKLWSFPKSSNNHFRKINNNNWKVFDNEFQTKFNSLVQKEQKTQDYDKVGWCDVTRGFLVSPRFFFRKFISINNYLHENGFNFTQSNIPVGRRFYNTFFRERPSDIRRRQSGLWNFYALESNWIGDEMRNEVTKKAPGSLRSTFETYEAGKVESKEKRPDCGKPKEKSCNQASCECAEDVEPAGRMCCTAEDVKEMPKKRKKKLFTGTSINAFGQKYGILASSIGTKTRSCKNTRTCASPTTKSILRNRFSAVSNSSGASGKCRKEEPVCCQVCIPCHTPKQPSRAASCPPPLPHPCCPPPCPPPKNRCSPPPCPCKCPPPCPPPLCCPLPSCPKMEALQFDPVRKTLNFYLLNAPTSIRKDEILVQIEYSGVCCTDLMIMEGRFPLKCQPVILGHELSGIACAVGSGVSHIKCGDCITVNPYGACHVCRHCTAGKFQSCQCEGLNNSIGIGKDGGWSEFIVVHKNQVFQIPPCLNLAQAVLVQPLSCVLYAASKLDLRIGANIVIQGAGISGSLWASLLHMQGHKNVMVSESNESKQKRFECLDLQYCILPPEKMCDITADIIIDCTGSAKSIERSIVMLNPNGQLCIFGITSPEDEMSLQPYLITRKEATIFSTIMNTNSFARAINIAAAMGCRYLDYDKLGIQLFKLGQYEGALKMQRCDEISKIVFKIQDSK